MINKISDFFSRNIKATSNDKTNSQHDPAKTAAAALLVEIMIIDREATNEEEMMIKTLLTENFDLSPAATKELIELAKQEVAEATSLYQFTELVNQHFSQTEKFNLMKQLWQIALADDILDKYEESLIRQLADLLHIPHSQFIRAKNLVKKELAN
ncbi:MAG: hypothetical protein DRR42_16735 [Gammaproteobacteria bacterium]|nr:MAG: hypothetical protein DRR42_16735 [Gammaproteobacteria bacterium]